MSAYAETKEHKEIERLKDALRKCNGFALQGLHEPECREYFKAIRSTCLPFFRSERKCPPEGRMPKCPICKCTTRWAGNYLPAPWCDNCGRWVIKKCGYTWRSKHWRKDSTPHRCTKMRGHTGRHVCGLVYRMSGGRKCGATRRVRV